MTDISDLPLARFASGSLLAGGDDLARMEQVREELIEKRNEVAASIFMLPEQRKRRLASIDADIKLLSQAIIAQKEFVRLDPDRTKAYLAEQEALAQKKLQAELEKASVKDRKSVV